MQKIVLNFRCAVTKEPFQVLMGKEDGEDYTIRGIVPKPLTAAALKEQGVATDKVVDSIYFNFTGWYCPHCSHKTGHRFVNCSKCGELVCGGRVQELGQTTIFHCACGNVGEIQGDIAAYKGSDFNQQLPQGGGSNLPAKR